MSDTAEKNPAVMRHALEWTNAQFSTDHELTVLFTSFNFSSSFFEGNVLPLLLGDAAEELQAATETRYAMNAELARVKCLVACDRSAAPEPKGGMRYALLPVGLARGRFHPKMMLMAGVLKETGAPGLFLAVGSGNLTLSGWAVNREIAGVTVVNRQHAGELLLLLRWLREQAARQFTFAGAGAVADEGDARGILDTLIQALEQAPESQDAPALHLALPFAGGGRGTLLERLLGGAKFRAATVVSPFWSQVDLLVARLGVEACRFVPSLRAGHFRFPLEGAPAYARRFGKFARDAERYTHAKALLLEGETRVLCTGSTNFTLAALGVADGEMGGEAFGNVEAVLRYDLRGAADPWRGEFAVLGEDELTEQLPDEDEDGAPPLPPFEAIMLCDWEKRVFYARLTMLGLTAVRDVELRVDGQAKFYAALAEDEEVTTQFAFDGVQPVRSFYVTYRQPGGKIATYAGLVTQVNAAADELGYAPRPRLKRLLELLRALDPAETEGRARARAEMRAGGDGEEGAEEPSFDFFGLFQASLKLFDYYTKAGAAGLGRNPYDPLAPFGVTSLYRAIMAQPAVLPEELIGRYVQLKELCAVAGRLGGEFPYRAQADAELAGLHAKMGEYLKDSPAFGNMFGEAAPQRADVFLDWFCDEIGKAHA